MSKQPVPKVSKAHLVKAMTRLTQLETEIAERKAESDALRHKMADVLHPGDPATLRGTKNVKLHGFQVTVERKLNISINKEAEEQLAADDPELYDEVMPEKLVRKINDSKAASNLDKLAEYATTKQGLPTVKFKQIES